MPTLDPTSDLRCSLLILLATPAEEAGLLAAAGDLEIRVQRNKLSRQEEFLHLGQIGDEVVLAVCPSRQDGRIVMGAHGRFGSAAKAIRYRERTDAQTIVQLGMAFGVDSKAQRLGDVLVSSALIHYDDRIIRDRLNQPPGYWVDYTPARVELARPALVGLLSAAGERQKDFRVHMGAILSGGARIHSAVFRDLLISQIATDETIVGGEMEAVGLLAASSDDDPHWCVVKGISDFADADREAVIGQSRPQACRNAAFFLLSALKNAGSLQQ